MHNQDIREHPLSTSMNSGHTAMNIGYLPDSIPVNNVLERFAEEKKWTKDDLKSDLAILARHRIVYVYDLRALSKESWAQIELLPLVKDLLRGAIDPDWYSNGNNNNSLSNNVTTAATNTTTVATAITTPIVIDEDNNIKKKDEKDKEKKKDKKKKEKKKDKKNKAFKSTSPLGTPVKATVFNRSQNDASSTLSDSSYLSQDHLTVQNTIRNGSSNSNETYSIIPTEINTLSSSNSSSSEEDDDESISRRKGVTFSNETVIGTAASEDTTTKEKKKKDKKNKKKDKMASKKYYNSGYNNFTNHPYTTHPIVKFRKMKMKHCKRLPNIPPNDQFLKRVHDKLQQQK